MRFSTSELDHLLQERLSPSLDLLQQRIQRTLRGPIARNGQTYFAIRKYRKLGELRSLVVLSYYLSEYGVLLRVDLEEVLSHLAYPQAVELAIMLSSKEEMLTFLIDKYSDDDFFGNFLPNSRRITEKLQFLTFYPSRAKKSVRHRGYRDHGSCRPESQWKPKSDWSLTDQMNHLETIKGFTEKILSGIMKDGPQKWILNYGEKFTIYD